MVISILVISSQTFQTPFFFLLKHHSLPQIQTPNRNEIMSTNINTPHERKRPGPKPGWKDHLLQQQSAAAKTKQSPLPPQATTGSGRKKPGPKPKDKFTATPIAQTKLSATKEFSKIPKRLSISQSLHGDGDDTESTITGVESTKRKRKIIDEDVSSVSSLGSLTANEIHEKLSKRQRSESLASDQTDDLAKRYSAVKNRYNVLLEILEQRYNEIRDLKLRIRQLEKRDQEDAAVASATPSTSSGGVSGSTMSGTGQLVKKEEIDCGSWSNAELSKAYSLQKLSRPFYRHVQERLLLPLPTIEVVEKYVDSIHMIRGLLPNMLQILEYDSETMTDVDRVTVLQITQIKTATIYEYDKAMDKILGPHGQMTVVVARGLYSNWSQAVYINFDVTVFKPCLTMIIEELHKIKYPVVACVCNYRENESSIWTELGVSMGCNYFAHPVTTDFIYAFYYVDDLLAEMRTQFCAEGFVGDLGRFSAKPLLTLLTENPAAKISLAPAMVQPTAKDGGPLSSAIAIRYAKEIFMRETANLVKLCLPKDLEAISCANFIEVICSFYAIMSSTNGSDANTDDTATGIGSGIGSSMDGGDQQTVVEQLPYGTCLELQNQVLSEIQLNFYRLRCPGVVKMSNIQRAVMMMIESLKMLQHSTKQKYKMDGIATGQITCDHFRAKLNAAKRRHRISDEVIAPLQAFAFIKEIFLQCNSAKSSFIGADELASAPAVNDPVVAAPSDNDRLFYDDPIDGTQPEAFYVQHLLKWLIGQHKIKHPHSVVSDEDLLKRFSKFEDTFQTMQNPHFQICDGAYVKVLKKLKTHNYGMSFEMLNLFVVQRHLLRIRYFNAIGVTNLNGTNNDDGGKVLGKLVV